MGGESIAVAARELCADRGTRTESSAERRSIGQNPLRRGSDPIGLHPAGALQRRQQQQVCHAFSMHARRMFVCLIRRAHAHAGQQAALPNSHPPPTKLVSAAEMPEDPRLESRRLAAAASGIRHTRSRLASVRRQLSRGPPSAGGLRGAQQRWRRPRGPLLQHPLAEDEPRRVGLRLGEGPAACC